MTSAYDVIVVGAGVEGSATAYQLINNGAKRVLLLEQVLCMQPYYNNSLPHTQICDTTCKLWYHHNISISHW